MIYIADETIERWIKEDVPYIDLTTELLGIGDQKGKISFYTRERTTVCGSEEVSRIFAKLGVETTFCAPSGTRLQTGEIIAEGAGRADALHAAWKVSLNVLEYACGIAERTREIVENARTQNENIEVVSTRKGFPGTKEISIKAVMAGGGLPHRLGLSETVLIFDQHRRFLGEDLSRMIAELKTRSCEKKIIAETDNIDDAVALTKAGIDGVQFDKVPEKILHDHVARLRALNPALVIIAAGGINHVNAAAYAAAGVNAIATSAMYFGKPADIRACFEPK
jgi:molybdenum transport protein